MTDDAICPLLDEFLAERRQQRQPAPAPGGGETAPVTVSIENLPRYTFVGPQPVKKFEPKQFVLSRNADKPRRLTEAELSGPKESVTLPVSLGGPRRPKRPVK